MTKILSIYNNDILLGDLSSETGGYSFCYAANWLSNPAALPISLALPLQADPFPQTVSQAFFSNLLPEGQLRDYYARKFRISPEDDFALLEALGGDCAGAISLYPQGFDPSPNFKTRRYRPLSAAEQEQLTVAYLIVMTSIQIISPILRNLM